MFYVEDKTHFLFECTLYVESRVSFLRYMNEKCPNLQLLNNQNKLELWVTSLSDTPRLQYYDVQTLEYRYISKLIISPSKF